MKLNAHKRTNKKSNDNAALRRFGEIPAVLYKKNNANEIIALNADEFQAIIREIKPGQLATNVFDLIIDGKEIKAIVKGIQYHPTTYKIIHLDFQELTKDSTVKVNVPVSCVGISDCVGIKLGGFLRQVLRSVKVECSSDAIPKEFVVDVKDLGIRQTKRLSDLALPKNVKPLAAMNEVLVVIAKR